jgi:hypothetical protein
VFFSVDFFFFCLIYIVFAALADLPLPTYKTASPSALPLPQSKRLKAANDKPISRRSERISELYSDDEETFEFDYNYDDDIENEASNQSTDSVPVRRSTTGRKDAGNSSTLKSGKSPQAPANNHKRTRPVSRVVIDDEDEDEVEVVTAPAALAPVSASALPVQSQSSFHAGMILATLKQGSADETNKSPFHDKRKPAQRITNNITVSAGDDILMDIQCTPYDIDPSSITIVRGQSAGLSTMAKNDPTSSSNGRAAASSAKNTASKGVATTSKKSAQEPEIQINIATISSPGDSPVAVSSSRRNASSLPPKRSQPRNSSAANEPQRLPLRIALSGFEPNDGEAGTMENMLSSLIRGIEQVGEEEDTRAQVITTRIHRADELCTHVVTTLSDKRFDVYWRWNRSLVISANGVFSGDPFAFCSRWPEGCLLFPKNSCMPVSVQTSGLIRANTGCPFTVMLPLEPGKSSLWV